MIRPECFSDKWAQKPLGEVVEFLDHLRRPITAKDRNPGPYPYYGANGQQDSVADYIFDEPLVLLAEDGGYFGDPDRTIAYRVEGKCWVNNHAHVLRPKDDIDLGFLCRVLERYDVSKFINGATRAKLNKGIASTIPIPLPPLPEQRRIAAILDKADAIRRKRQEAIRLTENFLRSVFLEMFGDPVTNPKGWEVEKLGAITKFENGDRSKNYPSGDDIKAEGVLFLSTKNIVDGKLNLRNPQFITKEKYQSLSQGKAKPLDLLITLRGTLGNCCVFNSMFDRAFINAQMMIIRPNEKCKVDFLHSFMTSVSIRDFFQKIGQGAAVPQLTATQLRAIDVPLPPVDLQQRFSEIKARVVGVLETMVKFSNSRLFDSLVQRAFRGDL